MTSEMKIELRQTSASATEAAIRGHRVPIDRPIAKGGGDTGPMGGELFLAAVGGCFMSTLLGEIKARQAAISHVRVDVVGSLSDSPVRFAALDMWVGAESSDPELLEKLVGIADRNCIMMNTLRATLDVRVLIAAAV
jgi:putative redox protein